jgi:16S rRNA (cytosine1402-N4)-methyltransferase
LAAESVTLQKQKQTMHEPVLLSEVLELLHPKKGEIYLDATAGFGGHAQAIFAVTKKYQGSVLVDRDQMAIDYLRARFTNKGLKIIKSDFYKAAKLLVSQGAQFDMILADLGVSSLHFDKASRGFSFQKIGPLDMRMDQTQLLRADTIVNQWSLSQLEQLIREYGEEPRAKRISQSIIDARPIKTTTQLAEVIARQSGKWQKIHPATRTFQALRIAVNNELNLLETTLPLWLQLLKPGGRLAIISFHSLEDRIVKRYFGDNSQDAYDSTLKAPFKSPITASKTELVFNPRARSAKLRAVVKK